MWPQCETLASPDHVTGDSRATARIAIADQAFCVAYVGVARFNATDATRRAYPNIKDADVYGTTVFRRPKVAAYVANLKARANKIAEEKFDLTIERIAHEFCAIAVFDIIDLFNDDGTLKPLKEFR